MHAGILKEENSRVRRRFQSVAMRERLERQKLRRQGQTVAPAIRVPSPRPTGLIEIVFPTGDTVFHAMVAKKDAATVMRSHIGRRHKEHLRLAELHRASLLLGGYNTPCPIEDRERQLRRQVAAARVIQGGVRGLQTRQGAAYRHFLAAKEAQRQVEIDAERQRRLEGLRRQP